MANFTPSRLGLVNNTGSGIKDLFLKTFAGEVLSAFRKATIFEDLHTTRTISSGKSAQFPIVGLSSTSYHSPGTQLTGNAIKHAEAVINIDDKLVSNVFIADVDEAMNHYDVRSQYSVQMGNALAYTFDQNVAANNLPEEDRYCAIDPTNYYKLVQNTTVINRDFGGRGAYSEGEVLKVAGIHIVKSNHLPKTNRSAVTGENNTYHANFTDNIGLVFNKQAVGTVKLMDLKMEQTGADIHALYQGTFMVGSMMHGSGVLRPDCAIELYAANS